MRMGTTHNCNSHVSQSRRDVGPPILILFRRLARETSGAEIAEAAAVLPIMFMIIVGIFWFGQAFSIYGTITRAAQEGARAGAAPNCTTCTANSPSTNASNAIGAALAAANLNVSNARPPVPATSVTACGGVSIPACGTNICVQWPIQLSNTTSGATGVCGISVSFQYPFRFWLPFTPLNKQQIWMTAAAQVRMESQ
jgi:Flp pilus assembly protein TadG